MTAKINILLIAFLISSVVLYGQDRKETERKHEVGICLYNMFGTPYGIKTNSDFHHNFVSGITYKAINYDNAIRLGLKYQLFNDNYQNNGEGNLLQPISWDVNYKGIMLNAGYEFYFNNNKVQTFLIADVNLAYGKAFEYHNSGSEINLDYNVLAIGLQPGFGVKYKFYKNLSVSIEAGITANYLQRSIETSEPNYNFSSVPTRIALNYYFTALKQF